MVSSTYATTSAIGLSGGEFTHVQTEAELASHTHNYYGSGQTGGTAYPAPNVGDNIAVTAQTSAVGSSTAMNVTDPFLVLNYIIKY
jgi:microcystin-dependent protein